MAFWWVNQNKTYQHEFTGGYLWSPKTKANGARNPFYDSMRLVVPGDLILSFRKTYLCAVGIAESICNESPKPAEFGRVGTNWSQIGWRIDVAFRELTNPVRPVDHIGLLRPYLPRRYSPLADDGRGVQSVYLTRIPTLMMYEIARLVGPELIQLVDSPPVVAHDPLREENPVKERWEHRLVEEIRTNPSLPETERKQLVYARVGQGRFRGLVYAHEKRCRVTRVDKPEHLVASHIKPWRHGTNDERLDAENGFMLTPNVDHLFDRGFISFSDQGELLISPVADGKSLVRMGLDPDSRIQVGTFSAQQRHYLDYHRESIFLENRLGA